MQVALICPPSLLKRYGVLTRYHLTLPHLSHQARYRDFYQARSSLGDYIILDNGAAEGVEFGAKHLHTLAGDLGADEIVVPDVLADHEETLKKVKRFARHVQPGYNYMAVAQGTKEREVIKAIDEYMKMPWIRCIGIPRLIMQHDRPAARVSIAKHIEKLKLHEYIDFHALGAWKWKEEVEELAEVGVIRGIDTSLPIVLAYESIPLSSDKYASRQPDFFERSDTNPLIQSNCNLFLMRAQYDRSQYIKRAPAQTPFSQV